MTILIAQVHQDVKLMLFLICWMKILESSMDFVAPSRQKPLKNYVILTSEMHCSEGINLMRVA
jgi:hypothetical protein